MNRLPRTLKSAMSLVGMSNQQLADAMTARGFKMTPNTISKILSGHRDVKFGEVEAFAAILGAPLEWLSQGPDWMPDGPGYGDGAMGGYIGDVLGITYTQVTAPPRTSVGHVGSNDDLAAAG